MDLQIDDLYLYGSAGFRNLKSQKKLRLVSH